MAVDLILNGMGKGEVASEFLASSRLDIGSMKPFIGEDGLPYISVFSGGDPERADNYKTIPIQTNATLRRDEWKQLDEAVLKVAQDRLTGVNDLISKGLVYNLGNAMGTTVLEWHDVSDSQEAVLTMDGVTRGQGDRPVFQTNYLPIPIIHVDYEINTRALEASRKLGNPLDTIMAEHAARKVAEKQEDMLFTNTDYAFGTKDDRSRNKIYSYVNFPDRNQQTIVSWTASAKTASDIISDVLTAKQTSITKKHYGPWTVYIPTGYETKLDEDYDSTTPGTTIRERLLKIAGINEVKVADHLEDDNVLLVEMKSTNVRLVEGMGMQTVQWSTEGRFITKFKVIAIRVPQIRSDQDGNNGIVHMSV
jgi:uncharacterized linocin/CFP29 family protein